MKLKKALKPACIVLGIIVPIIIIMIYVATDMGLLFNSWRNTDVKPDWKYVFLVLFKLTIYIIPPLIGMIGFYLENRESIKKHKFFYYYIKALNFHILILLCIKLIADSILELDAIWGLSLFNSINEIQALSGYILTLFIKKNIKIEPGVDTPKEFKVKE